MELRVVCVEPKDYKDQTHCALTLLAQRITCGIQAIRITTDAWNSVSPSELSLEDIWWESLEESPEEIQLTEEQQEELDLMEDSKEYLFRLVNAAKISGVGVLENNSQHVQCSIVRNYVDRFNEKECTLVYPAAL